MAASVNYVIIPSKVIIYTGYPQWFKVYLKATKEIYKESDKLDILVSNTK